ncbi:triose-phosphate isomerase [Marinomonas mediterranea]|uniref:triose-phosphate isomerase n=1 Tax=Marinomonas mediterranea TaxID=119864 RepID=UPI00234B6528|nr:triose-phosphate isomerase [Marinomonas mediterranea]WCN12943.1 triose-phosphate isomerase [Marinomonas mediterranea]
MHTPKTFWIGTSWKMNKTSAEALDFSTALLDSPSDDRIQRFVIPPFPYIHLVKSQLSQSSVKVGAQNMHWESSGAWTGEVSPLMLKDAQLDLVELGHSERREFFGETDEFVGRKVASAIEHGLIPLICIGEPLDVKESGRASEYLAKQIEGAFQFLSEQACNAPMLIAYEPIWAIGEKGTSASPSYANARHQEIKAHAHHLLKREVACLYGGSVNAQNCKELAACEHIDGLFIGRAAWEVDGFKYIINACTQVIHSNKNN